MVFGVLETCAGVNNIPIKGLGSAAGSWLQISIAWLFLALQASVGTLRKPVFMNRLRKIAIKARIKCFQSDAGGEGVLAQNERG